MTFAMRFPEDFAALAVAVIVVEQSRIDVIELCWLKFEEMLIVR
jgi:hypothetical protein